ncbi:MAG: peptidase M23 [Candidatus Magasanikbacteria bacterium CG_4_10_14_0_2_um_filter_37_12]|uniref:Peptidase M23 n=1 Tax=Candidatus Magasanikbacteria bacterium CG_4_10_14_0_2_um_filter_37_12 TaxID=1974637 RepID=A0A2M7VA70_9BACT|nr:MAG: peptidase M23 [Candidatus Magasanikbacteria bacterium CG_4_10_14_0_2_um_filter_37_12]
MFRLMKKILLIISTLALFGIFIFHNFASSSIENGVGQNTHNQIPTKEENMAKEIKETFLIEDGDTFAVLIEKFGLNYGDMLEIIDTASTTYDFTKIKAGKKFQVFFVGDVFRRFEYDIDTEEMVIVSKDSSWWSVERKDIPYEVTFAFATGVIESSLFMAGNDAGMQDRTILALADVFAWEIDFATVIQKGDSFSLIYEKRIRNEEEWPDGNILVATFSNQGKKYTAVRFVDQDGGVGYYAIDGTSLQKPFLKAPVKYSRITSGYSNARFHPVIGQTTAHLAIDYAAPIGTPILATGDGLVITASWNGGYGNFISIRHNNTWDTHYAHLSRYAVKVGDRVSQGDVIGYVGSTGWSTGPHVHYEMVKNGTKVNPLTVKLPAGDPIKDEWKDLFEAKKQEFLAFFAS